MSCVFRVISSTDSDQAEHPLPQEKGEPEQKSPSRAAMVEEPKKEWMGLGGAAAQDGKRWSCGPARGVAAGVGCWRT
jgi:hypothetical protein